MRSSLPPFEGIPMNSIRQLETRTKLFACFAIVLLGALAAAWLLGQLAQMSDQNSSVRAS